MPFEFTVTYDGPSVRDGLMDVRELAPALLSTGALVQKANHLLNGDRVQVSVQVRSSFKRGSFIIALLADQSLLDQAKAFLLQHPQIKDVKEILEILFFYGGFFKLINFLGKRKPETVSIKDDGDVEIRVGDQSTSVTNNVYNLYLDSDARKAAGMIVAPLRREGIDRLDVEFEDEKESVTKEEADYFEFEAIEGEPDLDNSSDALVELIRLSFRREHKWGFTDGGRNFNATVEDDEFWKQIDKGEVSFSEGDQMYVRLRTRTFRTESGLKSEHVIQRVIRYIPRKIARQLKLPSS